MGEKMEVEVGRVTEYFDQIGVAVLMLKRMLKVGDQIRIQGQGMDVTQQVTGLEIGHTSVLWAQPGDDVALAVTGPVNVHDRVYRVVKKSS
jgi:translation elongation factor EF-1alpha